jgi:hypothetical protein
LTATEAFLVVSLLPDPSVFSSGVDRTIDLVARMSRGGR